MPLRLQLLAQRSSKFDLPILPFLAPRVFEPWPTKTGKFRPDSPAVRCHSTAASNNYDSNLQSPYNSWNALGVIGLDAWQKQEHPIVRRSHHEHNTEGKFASKGSTVKSSNLPQFVATSYYTDSSIDQDQGSRKRTTASSKRRFHKAHPSRLCNKCLLLKSLRSVKHCDGCSRRHPLSIVRQEANSLQHVSKPFSQEDGKPISSISRAKRSCGSGYLIKALGSNLQYSRQHIHSCSRSNLVLAFKEGRREYNGRKLHILRQRLRWTETWRGLMASLGRIRPMMVATKEESVWETRKYQALSNEPLGPEWLNQFRDSWAVLPLRRQLKLWPKLMESVLARHSGRALEFLDATFLRGLRRLPISDTLHCIITYHFQSPPSSEKFILELTKKICDLLLRSCVHNRPRLPQYSIYLMLRSLPVEDLKAFLLMLEKVEQHLHDDTLLQFAFRLAKGGETDLAFQISRRLTISDDVDASKFLSLCTTMLQNSVLNANAQYQGSDIFRLIQEFQLTPNIITYNVLMMSAIENGNHTTAWRIHNMMIDSGIETDAFTYSILLNDAKWRMDSSAIETVMGLVSKRTLNNAHIYTDVLHVIQLLSLGSKRASHRNTSQDLGSVFDRMLKVYCEHFHIEPLTRLIPQLSGLVSPPTDPGIIERLLVPAPATFNIMITAFLNFGRAHQAQRWYAHFRSLVVSGDPVVKDLMQTSYIYNVILMVFRRHPELRGEAPKVIADMLAQPVQLEQRDSSLQGHKADDKHDGPGLRLNNASRSSHIPPKPDVFTWTILLKIFMMQGHARAAEKVLAMMVRRGVKPSIVTWNNLIKGYEQMQDAERTANAVHRLEAAGLKSDASTYESLRRVRDRATLSRSLAEKKIVVDGAFVKQLEQEVLASELEKRLGPVS